MRRAQVWSTDLVIGVVIFLLAIGVFALFSSKQVENDDTKLRIESQLVADKLIGEDAVAIVDGASVDEERLQALSELSYEDLQQQLGVKNDVCIILTDQDGNIILVGERNLTGIGNGEMNITLPGVNKRCRCGQPYESCV